MADSRNVAGPSVPSPDPAAESAKELALVSYLARQAGLGVDAARIAGVLSAHQAEEPLERVVATLPAAGLRADVARLPLASALWQARASLPLIIYSRAAGWTVVVGGGLFRERVAAFDGDEQTRVITRLALVEKLGLTSAQSEVEVAFVSPALPLSLIHI
jgi:hypothetical protein